MAPAPLLLEVGGGAQPRAVGPPAARWVGSACATVSGFTSFVAHAGSPPIAFYVLPLRLAPIVYTATMAVFFAAVNLSKWVPYAWLGLIETVRLLAITWGMSRNDG